MENKQDDDDVEVVAEEVVKCRPESAARVDITQLREEFTTAVWHDEVMKDEGAEGTARISSVVPEKECTTLGTR